MALGGNASWGSVGFRTTTATSPRHLITTGGEHSDDFRDTPSSILSLFVTALKGSQFLNMPVRAVAP